MDDKLTETAIKDLPDEILEQMLFAELVNNQEFANRIAPIFRDEWISDNELRPMSKLVIGWRSKFSTDITRDLIQALLVKYVQTRNITGLNIAVCVQKFVRANALDLGGLPKPTRIKTINEFIRKNILKDAIIKGAEMLSKGNLSGVVDKCLAVLENAERFALNDTDTGLIYNASTVDLEGDEGKAVKEHYDAISNPSAKISTGWPTLDLHTSGGFLKQGKSLYIIMGQAGLGKTVALSNLGYNFLCQGLKIVVFTLEMSNDMYGRRFDSLITNVNLDDLGPLVETVKERTKKFYKDHPTAELVIKEFPPRSANVNTFGSFIDNLAKERGGNWKPDVILVDYLNLVSSTTSSAEDNMYQEGLRVSEQLRALSYRFEVPVVTAVQTNTEGMDTTEIGMKNISQSRGIAHTADFIMAIYSHEGQIMAKIIKNRLGAAMNGKNICFKRDEETLRMTDLELECDDSSTSKKKDDAKNAVDDSFSDVLDISSFASDPTAF